ILLVAFTFANASLIRTKALIVVIYILMFAFWFVCNMFTGNGVTDAVYYHLKSDIHGASVDDILPKVYAALSFISLCLLILVGAFKLRGKISSKKAMIFNGLFVVICLVAVSQSRALRNVYNSLP